MSRARLKGGGNRSQGVVVVGGGGCKGRRVQYLTLEEGKGWDVETEQLPDVPRCCAREHRG
jgi:hypothetical protein